VALLEEMRAEVRSGDFRETGEQAPEVIPTEIAMLSDAGQLERAGSLRRIDVRSILIRWYVGE